MLLQLQGEAGSSLGPEELRSPTLALLLAALENTSPLLRCVAAEGLARLVQVVGEPGFTVSLLCLDRYADANLLLASMSATLRTLQLARTCCFSSDFHCYYAVFTSVNAFKASVLKQLLSLMSRSVGPIRLKTARDAASRSGYALTLGALQRYSRGVSSTQHLNNCLGVLVTLSQDNTSPEVQVRTLTHIHTRTQFTQAVNLCVCICVCVLLLDLGSAQSGSLH